VKVFKERDEGEGMLLYYPKKHLTAENAEVAEENQKFGLEPGSPKW
jgi:hypothetical protein